MTFDDNALYRHKELAELRDLNEEDPLEVEASNYKLNYIKLDGSIGCMVNGAGLAMGTMDIIKLSGGSPGEFRLDVGGSASAEQVKNAFKILISDDKSVKGRLHKYLWRHPALRCARKRRRRRGEGIEPHSADRNSHGRDQRGKGTGDFA